MTSTAPSCEANSSPLAATPNHTELWHRYHTGSPGDAEEAGQRRPGAIAGAHRPLLLESRRYGRPQGTHAQSRQAVTPRPPGIGASL